MGKIFLMLNHDKGVTRLIVTCRASNRNTKFFCQWNKNNSFPLPKYIHDYSISTISETFFFIPRKFAICMCMNLNDIVSIARRVWFMNEVFQYTAIDPNLKFCHHLWLKTVVQWPHISVQYFECTIPYKTFSLYMYYKALNAR